MTKYLGTQKFILDPNGPPIFNVDINVGDIVESASIISTTVRSNGIREITLGTTQDTSTAAQASVTVDYVTVGKDIDEVIDVPLTSVRTVINVLFVPLSIIGNSQIVAIVTISTVAADVNGYTTRKFLLDEDSDNPIYDATGIVDGSFMVVTGEYSKPHSETQGAKDIVLITVSKTDP